MNLNSIAVFALSALLAVSVAGAEKAAASGTRDLAALKAKMADRRVPMTWVITGDSITQGAMWVGMERPYAAIVEERVRWELHRKQDLFVNSGVSGETSTGLLANFDFRVLRFHPDVVSIMIGMNDASSGAAILDTFDANVREMIRRVREAGGIPILINTNQVDPDSKSARKRPELPAFNERIDRIAKSTDTLLVDNWSHWAAADLSTRRSWLGESIHPNGAGHRQIAIEFFKTIDCYDPKAPMCAADMQPGS